MIKSSDETNKQNEANVKPPSNTLLGSFQPQSSRNLVEEDLKNLYFGDFMQNKDDSRYYEEIKNLENLKQVVEGYLNDYNLISKVPMDLVIFGFVIKHLSRISRILKQPNGHGLLIGIGGTGRSSVTKLATFIADFELFQIEVSKKYTVTEWRADLKSLIKKTGENCTNVVFLFCDHQIKDESFLEDINMLLNSGDVPSLFENEEKLDIIEKVLI